MGKPWLLTCVVAAGACGFPRPPDVPGSDANSDTNEGICFGSSIQICLQAPPTQPLVITNGPGQVIDTTTSPMCATLTSSGNYCVVAATNIVINGSLRATGARPLVLLSTDSITSAGEAVIDVGSHRARQIGSPETGAGADPADCESGTAPAGGGLGGGAGGSFIGLGGDGGPGNNTPNTPGEPGAIARTVTALRGGCAGQNGDGASPDRGTLGHGGGAVLLIALHRIDIGGGINAGGEGGAGGVRNGAGGGGGGAGGMIEFDAPVITATGSIVANGGAGGEGSNPTNMAGADGADATAITAALGGRGGSTNGGDGGNGSSGDPTAGLPGGTGITGGGGGGGGGGAGIVITPPGASLGGMVSPPPTSA